MKPFSKSLMVFKSFLHAGQSALQAERVTLHLQNQGEKHKRVKNISCGTLDCVLVDCFCDHSTVGELFEANKP